jgi:ParB-like chromosome segregation protein Spo0J
MIKLSVIPTDKIDPSWVKISEEKIDLYRKLLREGSRTPPLYVKSLPNDRYEILDGNHRLKARQREGWSEIEVIISGPDEVDAEARREANGGVRDIWSVRRSRGNEK